MHGRRFDAVGQPLAGEFRVNATNEGIQFDPAVAMDAAGDFIIVWSGGAGGREDVFAQRYGASGEPLGGNFRVNTATAGAAAFPDVAVDAAEISSSPGITSRRQAMMSTRNATHRPVSRSTVSSA